MRNCIRGFASASLLVVASTVLSLSIAAQQVPQQLQPPANEQLLLQVHAKGDQVYTCKGDAAQFTWTLKAPASSATMAAAFSPASQPSSAS